MPGVGRVCCRRRCAGRASRRDPTRLQLSTGGGVPPEPLLRGNASQLTGPGSAQSPFPSAADGGNLLARGISAGLRLSRAFPFRAGRTIDRRGTSDITTPLLITNGHLIARGAFSGLRTYHFNPQGRPGRDHSLSLHLSAYLHVLVSRPSLSIFYLP